jgi:hypothetical protein
MTISSDSQSELGAISSAAHNIEIAIDEIRVSSRRSIIIISLMLLISLISASALAYYAISVSNKLKIARKELDNSKGSLELVANRIDKSENLLRQGIISNNKNQYIAQAIEEIQFSKASIRNADNSINIASRNIPFSQTLDRGNIRINKWFSVIGSYKVSETNLALAESFARRVSSKEVCTSIWITPGNKFYAVVFGNPGEESQTRLTVALLMEKKVVDDAFAQYDVDGKPWKVVRHYGNCVGGANF